MHALTSVPAMPTVDTVNTTSAVVTHLHVHFQAEQSISSACCFIAGPAGQQATDQAQQQPAWKSIFLRPVSIGGEGAGGAYEAAEHAEDGFAVAKARLRWHVSRAAGLPS
jgi:hypothetical protein